MLKISILLMIGVVFLFGCEDNPIPKPRGYFRIDLPDKEYTHYSGSCPFELQIPVRSKVEIIPSSSVDSCWFNISFPHQKAKIHFTYLPIKDNLNALLDDAYGFAFKHEIKANAIVRSAFNNPKNHVSGLIYDIQGDVASNLQFYMTDSTRHFMRGALYFNVRPNEDSLSPVLKYIREDVVYMMETLSWRDE